MCNLTQELTQKHLSVLIAIQENPLGTYDWISSRVGLSKSIVFGIIQDLSSPRHTYFNVVATPNNWNLGKEKIDLLVQADNEKKLQFVEKLCYEHPYTQYQARCFGDLNGLLIQLSVPKGTHNSIIELFEIIKEKELIDEFKILPYEGVESIYTTPNADFWNSITHQWQFDIAEWFTCDVKNKEISLPTTEAGSAKNWLTQSHVAVLKHLVKDARRKNTDIIADLKKEGYDFTPQTFSRYIKKVKDECISNYKVNLTATIFDLYSTALIWGSAKRTAIKDLESRILQLSFPFSSTFKTKNDQLFWYLHLPPSHLSNILFHLRKKLTDMHFHYVDFNRATTFLPWPPTFDNEKHDWRTDSEFMIDGVLKGLKVQ